MGSRPVELFVHNLPGSLSWAVYGFQGWLHTCLFVGQPVSVSTVSQSMAAAPTRNVLIQLDPKSDVAATQNQTTQRNVLTIVYCVILLEAL